MMHESLPSKLRLLRAREGLTLIEAAGKIGIGRDTLSDLERGNRRPVMPTLSKIAEGYGVEVGELLEEETVGAGKAEAPETGPSAREKSVVELVRNAVAKQDEQDWQAIARSRESQDFQISHVRPENEVMRMLLERPQGDVAEACIDLAKRVRDLEQMNSQLGEQLESVRLELAQHGAAESAGRER